MKAKSILFEFEDKHWFPGLIRSCQTEYLRYILEVGRLYEPAVPLIGEALAYNHCHHIVDLCSGAGGCIRQMQKDLSNVAHTNVRFTLSDKFPNIEAFRELAECSAGKVDFEPQPVDAMAVPSHLSGLRTMFSAFHHFNAIQARSVLKDAVQARQGIAIFDGGDRNIFFAFAIVCVHIISIWLLTPFVRPFRFSRLLFTYLIPIIPFCTIWDGLVSILRLHEQESVLKMAHEAEADAYLWKSGKLKNRFGMTIIYLIGLPSGDIPLPSLQ